MCFATSKLNKRVAKKDIIVTKFFAETDNNEAISVVRYFKYTFDKLYESKLDIPIIIKDGIQRNNVKFAYSDAITNSVYTKILEIKPISVISKGIHSMNINRINKYIINNDLNKSLKGEYSDSIALKCIIPKGATYYADKIGYYVSNKIIVTNKRVKL